MLRDINDLLDVSKTIENLNQKRDELAIKLKECDEAPANGTDVIHSQELLVDDIMSNVRSIEDLGAMKEKYGDLIVFQQLQYAWDREVNCKTLNSKLDTIREEINGLISEQIEFVDYDSLHSISSQLKAINGNSDIESPEIRSALDELCNTYKEKLLIPSIKFWEKELMNEISQSKWDTSQFVPASTNVILKLRSLSTSLYKLSQLHTVGVADSEYSNFKCIAHNFKVRFTYHFHEAPEMAMETYFNFLNDYLLENLYKCISIFSDEPNGISKQLVHEHFINQVLQPIRDKVKYSLAAQKDLKTIVGLISQVIATDRKLKYSYQYQGTCLASLVNLEVWQRWINYEVELMDRQVNKLFKNPHTLKTSGQECIKLLGKVYEYMEPFYELEYEPLQTFKLSSFSHIFLKLTEFYLQYVLEADALQEKHTKEDALQQTITKLENLHLVYKKIFKLSQKSIFIRLTNLLNQTESKKFVSIFQNVLEDYSKNIDDDILSSITNRIQKLMKDSLQNYFKLTNWSMTSQNEQSNSPTTTSSELVNSLKLLNRIISTINTTDMPLELALQIKHTTLNTIVNYFVESILKLNKFNHQGLKQFEHDYDALKSALTLPQNTTNAQDSQLQDTLKLLNMKYQPKTSQHFFSSTYIKNADFSDLKSLADVHHLSDTEIQDTLYRITYGNIV